MSTTDWDVSASGDWMDNSDWSNGTPTYAAGNLDAVIAEAGTYTVTISENEIAGVDTLALDSTNATLAVDYRLLVSDTFSLESGELLMAGAIGGGVLAQTGGSTVIAAGADLTILHWDVGGGTVSVDANFAYDGPLDQTGGTIAIPAGETLTILGSASTTLAGSISGAGTLQLSGDVQAIDKGASLSVSNLTIENLPTGPTLAFTTIAAPLSYGGTLTVESETDLIIAAGATLTITGNLIDEGAIQGGGTLIQTAGTSTMGTLSVAKWIVSGGTVTGGSYAGVLDFTGGIMNGGLSYDGTGATLDGTITGGDLDIDGTAKIGSGASISTTFFNVAGVGNTVTLATSLAYSGGFSVSSGFFDILSGDSMTVSGTSELDTTIEGAGTFAMTGGTMTIYGHMKVANWSISGGTTSITEDALTYTGTFSETGGTLNTPYAYAFTLKGDSTIAGTIAYRGTLALDGGTTTFDSGADLTCWYWNISGGTTTFATSLSYSGTLEVISGTLDVLSGDVLTLSGTSTIAGSIAGEGTLAFGGGAAILDSGAAIDTAALSLSNSATLGLKENLSFAGVVSQAVGASISVGPGSTLTLSGTGSTFDGTVTGKGTLLLDGGTDTLTGTTMQVSDWTLESGAVVTLGTDIVYNGALTEGVGTTLSLGSKVLTLATSSSTFAGAITGTAALDLKGGTQEFDTGATISTAHWNLSGKDAVTIDEDLTFAGTFSSGNGTKIAVSSGDTFDLTGDATISSKVSGAGTLEFSGGSDGLGKGASITATALDIENGASLTISAKISDTGAFDLSSGSSLVVSGHASFDLAQGATGAGTFVIDGNATLDLGSSVASTLTTNFDGNGATLEFSDLSGFAATISGFAAGDTVDLLKVKITSATLETGDVLVLTHGSTTVGTLQLSGNYASDTFTVEADGHGGTDITTDATAGSLIAHVPELHTSHADWIFG